MTTTAIEIGKRYRFIYPNYGTPDTHPDYTAHSGRVVLVERQLTDKECDPECGPNYWVRASDKWRGNVHASELKDRELCAVPECEHRATATVRISIDDAPKVLRPVCSYHEYAAHEDTAV